MTADDVLREFAKSHVRTCTCMDCEAVAIDEIAHAMASRIAADAAELARVRGELAIAQADVKRLRQVVDSYDARDMAKIASAQLAVMRLGAPMRPPRTGADE